MPATDRLKAALSDRYRIERELGAGGMATVYLARDLKHDREVALKVLRADLSAVIGTERFLEEVRITARLDHPHILTLIDSGSAEGILYYVLPYVRGESLRGKLNREKQLGIDEALSIVKQVASALDYAHEHGVVHRDIKPENILLHEGEAVLADFGIALAVSEAGGNRLTETGLSLGTPQYMSPEQATGDRALDKRSDIYSLGAVFYEMISGEPPVTGATAQAMIAKLLTERPVRLRVVRPTISTAMEGATEKALSKVPADRFSSAGEFVRALAVASPETVVKAPKRSIAWIAGGIAATGAIGFAVYMAGHGSAGPGRIPATLRDRTQLTTTGGASLPTISDDGKTLAYVVTNCTSIGCRYGIEVKDIASGGKRTLVEGATAVYRIEISPDRRNMVMLGSINSAYGTWLISLVDGTPRYLAIPWGSFYANGDSLVMSRGDLSARSTWMLFGGIDGVPIDSVRVEGGTERNAFFYGIPGTNRFIRQTTKDETTRFDIVERNGTNVSSISMPRGVEGGATGSTDALWVYAIPRGTTSRSILRFPLESATGKLSQKADTVYTGRSTGMSVSGDGGTLVYDEGVTSYSGWSLPFNDLVTNKFSDARPLAVATGGLRGAISPDGAISVIGREIQQGSSEFSVVPFGSLTEIPIPGRHRSAIPLDSMTIKLMDMTDSTTILSLFDYRTRQRRSVREIRGVGLNDVTRSGDAWVWIPGTGTTIEVQRDSEPKSRRFKAPAWYKNLFWVSGNRDGRIAFAGWKAPYEDSLGFGVLSPGENRFTQVYQSFGEDGGPLWLTDGSLIGIISDTPESQTFYLLKEGVPARRLGSTQRPISPAFIVSVSGDLKRAFVITRDDRRDAYMSKVAR
ncbi:MAG: protein kinase [Gemmatimonadales bacterium]